MNDVTDNRTLVLGATGKTGSRVAQNLLNQGIAIRTAARSGADVRFDWNDPSTFASALLKVSRVYLVSPVMRVDFADIVAKFLDEAERAGVRHVTYLSAYGMEHAPAEVALRAVELDLASRPLLSHSIVRPAWFMQNFSETFVKPANDEIVVPGAMGAEAFVNAEDIASVAAATLSDPERHAGRAYSPTGPEALTFEDVAAHISNAVGRKISYCDIDRNTWIDAMIQAGVPAEYGEVLRLLTETIASGRGSRPNNDVLTVTGKAPISFAEFAAKTAAAWRQ
ncbi:NmrA family protein [Dickeya chrysanthemi Ech1591]|uniref:NmrA family protein n=1 Tax=Dickeya chrysanthemi (strain Ech1591) TaxID=561229 RepID=C6CFN7_DICC1|nr:NmrA family NAD(P)-binding protein [Dickeya chrysanthemi]ACT06563.1 NmrA family protein [Dickeya chrysanthemi Ech1591]